MLHPYQLCQATSLLTKTSKRAGQVVDNARLPQHEAEEVVVWADVDTWGIA